MNTRPLISVIIPCYNYGQYLPEAVQSVMMQASDTLAVEAIVVDDGSTDDTAQVAHHLAQTTGAVRYFYQEHQGPSPARNIGIKEAHGEYLVFLDADDLLCANVLQSHLDTFAAKPELDASVCFCLQLAMTPEGKTLKNTAYLWPLVSQHLDLHLCHSNIAPIHNFMIRTSAVRDIGSFDCEIHACEDQDLWLRMAAAGKIFGVNNKGLVIYRRHPQSLTQLRSQQLAYDSVIRFKISKLLKENQNFPCAGKFCGWLAHAAGTLNSAALIKTVSPRFSQKLVNVANSSIEEAYKHKPRKEKHLDNAIKYCLLNIIFFSKLLNNCNIERITKEFQNFPFESIHTLKEKKNFFYKRISPVPIIIKNKCRNILFSGRL